MLHVTTRDVCGGGELGQLDCEESSSHPFEFESYIPVASDPLTGLTTSRTRSQHSM